MSVLIRLLPFWIIGILSSWVFIRLGNFKISVLIIAGILVLLFVFTFFKLFSRFPGSSIYLLPIIVYSGVLTSFSKSGQNCLPLQENIVLEGELKKMNKYDSFCSFVLEVEGSSHLNKEEVIYGQEKVLIFCGEKNMPPNLEPGYKLRLTASLKFIEKRLNSEEFPERLFRMAEGVGKKGWASNIEIISKSNNPLMMISLSAGKLQYKLRRILRSGSLTERQAALLEAMILGNKQELDGDIKELFRQTGISHLLAVSGLHVGLIYIIVLKLFSFIRIPFVKNLGAYLALLIVWIYAFTTGFSPSVQRAAGMISLLLFSRMIRRKVLALQILVLALFIQTLVNPLAIFSFGFQLSYLAVAGILVFHRELISVIKFRYKIFQRIWDFGGVSISAQSLTLPLIFLYFNEFPTYFLLGNLIIVPICLLMFYTGIAYLLLLSVGAAPVIMGSFLNIMGDIVLALGDMIRNLPFSLIEFDNFSILHLSVYFLGIILMLKKGKSLFAKILYLFGGVAVASVISIFLKLWAFTG